MNLWERKNKNGSTSYGVRYVDANGRKRRETFPGVHNVRVARLIYAERLARHERRTANLPESPNVSLGVVLQRYVDHCAHLSPRYVDGLRINRRLICETLDADMEFRDLRRVDLDNVIGAEQERGRSIRTINGRLTLISAAGKLAVRDGLIAVNPAEHPPFLTDRRPPVWRRLDDADYERILEVLQHGATATIQRSNGRHYETRIAPPARLYPLVVLLANTGARLGEALALTWDDISSDAVRLTTSKGAHSGARAGTRLIPINETLAPVLDALPRDKRLFRGQRSNIYRQWVRAQALAGIERHYRVHDLRHTFASKLADRGVAPFVLQRLMGHASINTTNKYYHAGGDQLAQATRLLDPQRTHEIQKPRETPANKGDSPPCD